MILIARFDRETDTRVEAIVGACERVETVLEWYRTHSRLSEEEEHDFRKRLLKTAGLLSNGWTGIRSKGMYKVMWIYVWEPGAFDAELTLAKRAKKKSI